MLLNEIPLNDVNYSLEIKIDLSILYLIYVDK